jgi:SH3 domain-containing YSC84-like protein 1
MRAQILTYSRARGAFAGATLNGAVMAQDKNATRDFYGRMVPFRTLLLGRIAAPPDAQPFVGTLAKYASGSSDKK